MRLLSVSVDSASLCVSGCFTLFATHFGRLGQLASIYPNARVWHLAVGTGAAGERLTYRRRLEPGAADDQHYGLLLASAVAIPADVRATSGCCGVSTVTGSRVT